MLIVGSILLIKHQHFMPKRLLTSDRQYCLEVIDLKIRAELDFLTLGRELEKIYRERKWESGWGSFEEYLVDMRMSLSTASKLRRIWSLFIEQHRVEPMRLAAVGGWSVVAEVLPRIRESKDVERYVCILENHPTKTDLRRTLHEESSGVDMQKCRHANVYYLRICEDCNLKERVYLEGDLLDGKKVAVCNTEVDNSCLHTHQ